MSRPYPFVGTALAAFESEFESELGFKEGTELIILSTKGHQGWWLGRHGEKQGLVPATYVKPRALQPGTIRADFQAEGPSELSTQQGDVLSIQEQSAACAFGDIRCVDRETDRCRSPGGNDRVHSDDLIGCGSSVF